VIERARPLLGTMVTIRVDAYGYSAAHLERLFVLAFAVVETVHQLMSVHDPNSDLSQLNRASGHTAYRPHPWTLAVLRRAKRMYRWSDGLFDPVVAARQLQVWQMLPQGETQHPPHSTLQDLVIDGDHVYGRQPLAVDLGGIAKGFAVDMAVLLLRRLGVRQAVVNAGGDLRVLGAMPEMIWVRDPRNPQQLHALGELSNGACATSAIYYSAHTDAHGIDRSALVHPYTEQALLLEHSYTVIAPCAVYADALTKVVAASQNPHHPILVLWGAVAMMLTSS
jgi:FAD:protein FMN transferase